MTVDRDFGFHCGQEILLFRSILLGVVVDEVVIVEGPHCVQGINSLEIVWFDSHSLAFSVRYQGLVKFALIKRHPIDFFHSLVNRFVFDWLDGFQSLTASVGLAPCKFGRLPQGSYYGLWGPVDSCQVCVCAHDLLARLNKRVRIRRHLYQVKKLLVADRHRLWRLDLVRTFVRTARYLDVKFVTGREVLV